MGEVSSGRLLSYQDSFKERHLKPAWEALGSSGLLSRDLLLHADNISTSTAHRECCGMAFSRHPSLPLLSLSWPVKSQADMEPGLLGWQVLPGRISPPAALSLASAQQASGPPSAARAPHFLRSCLESEDCHGSSEKLGRFLLCKT